MKPLERGRRKLSPVFWSTLRGQEQGQAPKENSEGLRSGQQQLCSVTHRFAWHCCLTHSPGFTGTEGGRNLLPITLPKSGLWEVLFLRG